MCYTQHIVYDGSVKFNTTFYGPKQFFPIYCVYLYEMDASTVEYSDFKFIYRIRLNGGLLKREKQEKSSFWLCHLHMIHAINGRIQLNDPDDTDTEMKSPGTIQLQQWQAVQRGFFVVAVPLYPSPRSTVISLHVSLCL